MGYNATRELMNTKNGSKKILGYLGVITGCIVGVVFLNAMCMYLFRCVTSGRIVNFWMVIGDLLFLGVAAYFIYVGRRAVYSAKGQPLRPAKFGWGRMLLGAILLFNSANSHFHLYPVRTVVKPLEASNPTQAAAMNLTAIAIAIGCAALIVSGIWKGLRQQAAKGASAASIQ